MSVKLTSSIFIVTETRCSTANVFCTFTDCDCLIMTVTNGSMEDKMITSMIPSKTKTDEQFF